MRGGYHPHRAARVLADAVAVGDVRAARLHGVSRRSVERYRARLVSDAELAGLVADLLRALERERGKTRAELLRRVNGELGRRLRSARLDDLVGALAVAGGLGDQTFVQVADLLIARLNVRDRILAGGA